MKFVFTVALGLPISAVIVALLPGELVFYQSISIGMVSAMISSAWLKYIES